MQEAAETLFTGLKAAGLRVLYDDRDDTAGVKFNDADLLGMPWRVTVSPRTLERGAVELKQRTEKEFESVPLADAITRITTAVRPVVSTNDRR